MSLYGCQGCCYTQSLKTLKLLGNAKSGKPYPSSCCWECKTAGTFGPQSAPCKHDWSSVADGAVLGLRMLSLSGHHVCLFGQVCKCCGSRVTDAFLASAPCLHLWSSVANAAVLGLWMLFKLPTCVHCIGPLWDWHQHCVARINVITNNLVTLR